MSVHSDPRGGDGRALPAAPEIVCGLDGGRLLTLYEPVGPARCDRCGAQADDVCFAVREPDGSERHGGLCGTCFAELLPL